MADRRPGQPGSLSRTHPLAGVAARHCAQHLGPARRFGVGQVACGACWERAIRDDERFVVEFGLPRELSVDPAYVDEIAVSLACQGDRVSLTPVERAEAVRRLSDAGLHPTLIAQRLSMSGGSVRSVLAALDAPVPFVPTRSGLAVLDNAGPDAVGEVA